MIQLEGLMGSVSRKGRTESSRVASEASVTNEGVVVMTLCLIVALTPLIFAARLFEPYIAPKEILVQAATATAAILWLLSLRVNAGTLPITPMWVPVLALALIGAGSVVWSSHPAVSLERGQYFATYILLFAMALSVMRHAEARSALATALTLSGAIVSVYVLLQYTLGDPIFGASDLSGKWRTFGTLGNPNWTGEFLAVTALVSLGQLISIRSSSRSSPTSNRISHHVRLAALILMILALAATLARGAWLAFIIGAIAFVVVRRFSEAPPKLKSIALGVSATTVAAVAVVVIPLLTSPASVDHLLNLKSVKGRIWMSAVTWKMIEGAPLIGHGLGTFGLLFPNYQAEAFSQPWAEPYISNASFTSYAHNDYLQLWAELGLIGLLAFGALVWIVLKRGKALAGDPIALGCWAGVISLLINAAVAFPFHLPTTLMLFVVLIAAVEAAVPRRKSDLPITNIVPRVAVVVVTLGICFSAYWFSYHRYVSDSALWRAEAALANERWREAETEIRTAILYAPARSEPRIMLARTHLERGEYEQALKALDEAQKLGFDERIFDLKATALDESGDRGAAIAVLNELTRLRPDLKWPRERLSGDKPTYVGQEKKQ